MATRYTVEIGEQTARVLAVDEQEASTKAVRKLFGASASWWADSGVRGLGQVTRPVRTGGSTCVTPRVSLRISEGW